MCTPSMHMLQLSIKLRYVRYCWTSRATKGWLHRVATIIKWKFSVFEKNKTNKFNNNFKAHQAYTLCVFIALIKMYRFSQPKVIIIEKCLKAEALLANFVALCYHWFDFLKKKTFRVTVWQTRVPLTLRYSCVNLSTGCLAFCASWSALSVPCYNKFRCATIKPRLTNRWSHLY